METSIVTFQVSMVTTHNLFSVRSASLKKTIPSDTGLFSLSSPLKSFRLLLIVVIVSVIRILNSDRQMEVGSEVGVGVGEGGSKEVR